MLLRKFVECLKINYRDMETVYIIVQANSYDGFESPRDHFYLTEEEAQKDCDELNRFHYGNNKKYWMFDVYDLILKK